MICARAILLGFIALGAPALAQDRSDAEPRRAAVEWPQNCVYHFEIGDTLTKDELSAEMIGYFDLETHHTGLRTRFLVFLPQHMPDRALVVSRGKVRGEIADPDGAGSIAAYFRSHRVLDSDDVSKDGEPAKASGLVYRAASPEISRLGCRA